MHEPHDSSKQHSPAGDEPVPVLPDLPPVEAPTAGFVVQLFVIPAVVVAAVIAVWLLFGKLAGGERDPAEYVRRLKQPSGDWRSAFELASLIQNDSRLAADPRLLAELTDLLATELKSERADPKLTVYLIKTVGAFQSLGATLADGRALDPIAVLSEALDAKLDPAIRMEAAASLAKHAARLEGKLENPAAVARLAAAAEGQDAELRQVAVFALGFFGGPEAAEALRARLRGDDNRLVRYNAAVALGRRGDLAAQATLKEMLSSAALEQVIEVANTSEKQNRIESIQVEALRAVLASLAGGSNELAVALRPEIEALTHSGLVSVRNQAQAVLQKLPSAS